MLKTVRGIDINHGSFFYPSYKNALETAIQHKKTDLIGPLLQKGANPNSISDGCSLQRAIDRDATTLPLLLQKGGLDPKKTYPLLALNYKEDAQGRLVSANNPKEHPGYCMNAPLIFACARNGKKKAVLDSLKNGARPEMYDAESNPVTFEARIHEDYPSVTDNIGWNKASVDLIASASKVIKQSNTAPLAGIVPTDPQGYPVPKNSNSAKAFAVAGVRNLVADFLTPEDAQSLAVAGRQAKNR